MCGRPVDGGWESKDLGLVLFSFVFLIVAFAHSLAHCALLLILLQMNILSDFDALLAVLYPFNLVHAFALLCFALLSTARLICYVIGSASSTLFMHLSSC